MATRYVWICNYRNHASHWEDREECNARSRVTFKSATEAQRALEKHIQNARHPYYNGIYGTGEFCGEVRFLRKYERWK